MSFSRLGSVLKLTSLSTVDGEKSYKAAFEDRPEIPRRPKKSAPIETNGNGVQNGKHPLEGAAEPEAKSLKRSNPEDGDQPTKKAKIAPAADDVVVVEDAGGAIVIDD